MAEFDVTGEWHLQQSNGTQVTFNIRPEKGDFTKLDVDARHSKGRGQGFGRVSGKRFFAEIHWEAGPIGRYTGTFGLDGRLSGKGVDLANPTAPGATWFSLRSFRKR